jgi:hypothetical protein
LHLSAAVKTSATMALLLFVGANPVARAANRDVRGKSLPALHADQRESYAALHRTLTAEHTRLTELQRDLHNLGNTVARSKGTGFWHSNANPELQKRAFDLLSQHPERGSGRWQEYLEKLGSGPVGRDELARWLHSGSELSFAEDKHP